MIIREIPQDIVDTLAAARQAEQTALRHAVADLTSQGWTRAEAAAAINEAGWSQNAIATALGLSKQRVWQLLNPDKDKSRQRVTGLAKATTGT